VFSGVLLDALWGLEPGAFSKIQNDCITSRSLGHFLEARVPEVAKQYGLKLKPTVSPTFPENDDVYLAVGQVATEQRPFAWPPPPTRDSPPDSPLDLRELPLRETAAEGAAGPVVSPRERGAPRLHADRQLRLLRRMRRQRLPRGTEVETGFAVDGARVSRLWTPPHVDAEPASNVQWWRVHDSGAGWLREAAPVLIELADGRFAGAAALPNFTGSILCDQSGVSAVLYRPAYGEARIPETEKVLAALERGAIGPEQVVKLATKARFDKHIDPMLGVIAAYLYDSIGDIGNIRRMAFYYARYGQPIPFDVALLAQVRGRQTHTGINASVPRVPAREPRTELEREYAWTYEETTQIEGLVGGGWPWLRQGWAFLAEPTDAELTLIRRGLPKFAASLANSRFPTFPAGAGRALAVLFGLVARSAPNETPPTSTRAIDTPRPA
jgi:hypothetical protein